MLDLLRQRPDDQHTPTGLAKALGRSSGAIANALVRLTLDGEAVEVSAKPRRYSLASPNAA